MTGLRDRLGIPHPRGGAVRKVVRDVLSRPGLTPVVGAVAPRLDRMVLSSTAGRTTATGLLTGLPVLWVTTTSRSGGLHTVPLVPIPNGDDLAVIGSAFGRPSVPRWARNLAERPAARVRWRDRHADVVARAARRPAEEERIWERAIEAYRGFDGYRTRAAGRPIPVFVLEPA